MLRHMYKPGERVVVWDLSAYRGHTGVIIRTLKGMRGRYLVQMDHNGAQVVVSTVKRYK